MGLPKLSKIELELMEALWTKGALSIREIQETFPEAKRPAYTTVQTMVYRLEGKKVVRRAKKTGQLRPDFTSQDLVILLMANAGVIAATRGAAPGTWERLVGYMLQAFTAPQPATLPPPPDPSALARAMAGFSGPASSTLGG